MAETAQTQIWVDQARSGDSLAVSKLLATYHSGLRARALERMDRQLRAKSEPDDILQQVYLTVLRQIAQFQGDTPDAFLNWVRAILDNKVIDARRALHRKVRQVDREVAPQVGGASQSYVNLLDQVYADSGTPSRVVRHQEALGALMASVSGLSDTHRQVIQLRFLEGRSVADVAQRLGKSQAAVVALTSRALAALRKAMDGLGEFTRGS